MKLTTEQKKALYKIVNGVKNGALQQSLGGYAGTGKTVVVKYLQQFFPNFAVCAFTGKAANILRKRNVPASTIHSVIYEPERMYDGTVEFRLKFNPECSGFIVDEASMVSEEIYEDLVSYGLPIIWVGDHGQLEPVGTNFNLMKNPMYKLETIHRNAGEIARFAEWLRKGKPAITFNGDGSQVRFISKSEIQMDDYLKTDQIICAYNKTRVYINNLIREHLNYKRILEDGEKIICLQNDKNLDLFNGMQGIATNVKINRKHKPILDFVTDEQTIRFIHYDPEQFGQEKFISKWNSANKAYFDYGYCTTCHKCQGDEWEYVTVYEQKCAGWEHKRWAYTAASRARSHLDWILG